MKINKPILTSLIIGTTLVAPSAWADMKNPHIDMSGYLKVAAAAAHYRESHLISEAEFIRRSQQPGTIILDARSQQKYNLLHIKGAINLNFSDIDVNSLQKVLPDKNAQILIYCNNNFGGEPVAFPSKLPTASLNLSTYIALYNYGYTNVYELEPFINTSTSKLPLVSLQP